MTPTAPVQSAPPVPQAPASSGIQAGNPTPTAFSPQTPSTFDTSGALSAIRNYYQIPQQTATMQSEAGGLATRGQQQVEALKISSDWATRVAERAADASSYRLQADPKGGPSKIYNIYTGQVVDPLKYSQLTGASPADVFKNSTNKNDQQFAQDYDNYQSYLQAFLNPTTKGSADIVKSYQMAHPELKQMTPDQLRQRFMQVYSPYFGGVGTTPDSEAFAPLYSPSSVQYGAERQFLYGTPPLGFSFSGDSSGTPTSSQPISSGVR